jgi:hypothetical protein
MTETEEEEKKKNKFWESDLGNGLKNAGISVVAQLVGIPLGILGISVPIRFGTKKPQQQSGAEATAAQPAPAEAQAQTPTERLSDEDHLAQELKKFQECDVYKNLPDDQKENALELFKNGGGTLTYTEPGSSPDGASPDGKQSLHPLSQISDEEAAKAFSQPGYAGEEYLADKDAIFTSITRFAITPDEKMALFKAGQKGYTDFEALRRKLNEKYGKGKTLVTAQAFDKAKKKGENTSNLYVPIAERDESLFPAPVEKSVDIEPYKEPPKPRQEPPAPAFKEVEKAQKAITGRLDPPYRGMDVNNKVGAGGHASDGDINNALLARDERAFQQAQAEMKRNAEIERGLKNANINTQLELSMRQYLHDTQFAGPEERQQGYTALVQGWMTNPAISPNAPGISEEEKIDRVMLLQQAGSKLALNTQQSIQQFDREKFLTDTSNNVQALIESTASGEGRDEENFGLMQTQILNARNRMSPAQFSKFAMESYGSFWDAAANKKVQAAMQQAEEKGELVKVNQVVAELSGDSEELYLAGLNAIGFKDPGGNARGHIFKNLVTTGIIEKRKILQDYNEGVIKQQEGLYQVWNNNGYYEPAKELGLEWRERLDAAAHTGDVDRAFYFTSRDFFKPMAVTKDRSGADVVKGNDKLMDTGAEMIITWFDTQGQGAPSPTEIIKMIKENWVVPEEYKKFYIDPDGRKNKALEALIESTLIDKLTNSFQDPNSYKSLAGGVHRIQELLVDADKVDSYFNAMEKKDKEKTIKTLGNKDSKLDANERNDMMRNTSNIIWGRIMDEFKSNMPNLGNRETSSKWISDVRKDAFSAYISYAARAGAVADEAEEQGGSKVGKSGLRTTDGLLAEWVDAQPKYRNPDRYHSNETPGRAGYDSPEEDMDTKAAERLLKEFMTNLSTKTTDIPEGILKHQYKAVPLNQYTQDYDFEEEALQFVPEGQPLAGHSMFEVGKYRFVFVKDGKKVNAEVYEKDRGGWTQKQTIKDIEKHGLRKEQEEDRFRPTQREAYAQERLRKLRGEGQ